MKTFIRAARWALPLAGMLAGAALAHADHPNHAIHAIDPIHPNHADHAEAPPMQAFVLPQPKALPTFDLTDHRGAAFDRGRFGGRWTLLLFGFSHCTDICPTTLAALAEVRRQLARRQPAVAADIVFVSIDPQRDTQARLAGYVGRFGPGITGVRGTPAQVDRLAEPVRVRYAPAGAGAAATIDHTASVSLIGPDTRLHAVFTLPLRPEQVAADVMQLQARRCGIDAASRREATCAVKGT